MKKLLHNAKGVKSQIFKLLNIKGENKKFEICFEFVANGFLEIEWDDYENLRSDANYSEIEEILLKYFRPRFNFGDNDGWGSISYHPDFKLTIDLETDTENQDISKDNDEYYCAEYDITNEGIFEIEYGSTKKFWESLKK